MFSYCIPFPSNLGLSRNLPKREMKMNTIIKDDATPKKPIDDDGIAPRETKEMAKKEENFFKI